MLKSKVSLLVGLAAAIDPDIMDMLAYPESETPKRIISTGDEFNLKKAQEKRNRKAKKRLERVNSNV